MNLGQLGDSVERMRRAGIAEDVPVRFMDDEHLKDVGGIGILEANGIVVLFPGPSNRLGALESIARAVGDGAIGSLTRR